jgi:hypothetical protein
VAGLAEANLGFICACAPSLNRLFAHFFGPPVHGSKHTSDPNAEPKRSEKSPHVAQFEQHSESSRAVDELEEGEVRLFYKSF